MAENVSTEECLRLARAMTFKKNAAAGIPHGGGKIVVCGDPKMDEIRKQSLLRALASSLSNKEDDKFAKE
jgi:glutamate dehydrogenase (NAD(P)+)